MFAPILVTPTVASNKVSTGLVSAVLLSRIEPETTMSLEPPKVSVRLVAALVRDSLNVPELRVSVPVPLLRMVPSPVRRAEPVALLSPMRNWLLIVSPTPTYSNVPSVVPLPS